MSDPKAYVAFLAVDVEGTSPEVAAEQYLEYLQDIIDAGSARVVVMTQDQYGALSRAGATVVELEVE